MWVSVFLGLGYTFYTGAVDAWLVDALKASGYDEPLERVFSRGQMLFGAAMLVGTIGGGPPGPIFPAPPPPVRGVAGKIAPAGTPPRPPPPETKKEPLHNPHH